MTNKKEASASFLFECNIFFKNSVAFDNKFLNIVRYLRHWFKRILLGYKCFSLRDGIKTGSNIFY